LSLGDITCAVGPIGLFLGRIANFINGELWGRPTDVPWAMVFPNGGPVPRHPSQLYEATLEGLVLFIILAIAMRMGALKRPGLIIGLFAVCYAVARIICEFFREPDVQLGFLWGGMTMGMLLSLPLMLGGFGFILYARRHAPLRA
jgi:phosphatidylglycerol---prolipoprotein diacylglyceryl transferase